MNNKSFHTNNPASGEGNTNTWFTPKHIIDALGVHFDLDPCTQTYRPHNTATNHICEDNGGNGLIADWFGTVWLNPPYGREIKSWLDKLAEHGDGVALVFSRTETVWAQTCLTKATSVNFIKGRISFIKADGSKGDTAANGSMLIAFGDKADRAIRNISGLYAKMETIADKQGVLI